MDTYENLCSGMSLWALIALSCPPARILSVCVGQPGQHTVTKDAIMVNTLLDNHGDSYVFERPEIPISLCSY